MHRLFQLPIEHEGKTAGYWALSKESQKVMRNRLHHIKLIIIDEVSMVSSLTLAYIHLRLEELFGNESWFGGKNIMFVGDILQLPPVNGNPVFKDISIKTLTYKLGCTTSVNIWKDCITYDELTINERQKKDRELSSILDSVRCGLVTTETTAVLKNRIIDVEIETKFHKLQQSGQNPVCLFPTRKACKHFNDQMLKLLPSECCEILCSDEVDETYSTSKWNKKALEQLEKLNKDCNLTAGLEAKLILAVGARVMLRRNINTKSGLVNGAIGTVLHITQNHITVQFDHMDSPYKVEKVKSKFMLSKKFYINRKQFPLILAFAVTIHKCQGLSLNCAIIDLSDKIFCVGMAYVALSRVRTLDGLHLTAFDPKSVMVSVPGLKECNRLRSTYRSDLPLYDLHDIEKTKRKLTGKIDVEQTVVVEKPKGKKRKASAIKYPKSVKKPCNDDKPILMTVVTRSKKRACSPPLDSKPSKKPCTTYDDDVIYNKTTTRNNNDNHRANYTRVNPLRIKRWNPVTEDWQRNACAILGLKFVRYNGASPGGPTVSLGSASRDKTKRIIGDGNCMFSSLSYIVTGCPRQHKEIRKIIVEYMPSIYHILISRALVDYTSVQQYIQET